MKQFHIGIKIKNRKHFYNIEKVHSSFVDIFMFFSINEILWVIAYFWLFLEMYQFQCRNAD